MIKFKDGVKYRIKFQASTMHSDTKIAKQFAKVHSFINNLERKKKKSNTNKVKIL